MSQGPNPEARFYQYSGRVPLGGLGLALALGGAFSIVAGVAFGWFTAWCSNDHPGQVIGLIAFAVAAGLTLDWFIDLGDIRNMKVQVGLGWGLAILVYVAHWVGWAGRLSGPLAPDASAIGRMLDPGLVLETMGAVARRGYIGYTDASASTSSSSWFRMGLWGLEAIILVPLLGSMARPTRPKPFCESCKMDCKLYEDIVGFKNNSTTAALRGHLEKMDRSSLGRLPLAHRTDPKWFALDLHQCPECAGVNVIDLKAGERTWNSENEDWDVTFESKMQGLIITPEDAQFLIELGRAGA